MDDLVCKSILCQDVSKSDITNDLFPNKECLMETVELWNKEGSRLLLLRDSILGVPSTTRPYIMNL